MQRQHLVPWLVVALTEAAATTAAAISTGANSSGGATSRAEFRSTGRSCF
jgi:hypothetical protein